MGLLSVTMTRVIKFRGKSIADGKWVYGDLVHTSTQKAAIWPTEKGHDGGMVEVRPNTVGQYTGQRDRNGNEIYEGDVVRQAWETTITDEDGAFSAKGNQTGIVVIRTRGVCLSPCLCENDISEDAMLTKNIPVTGKRSEIIGNSHDTPSLFEEICNS